MALPAGDENTHGPYLWGTYFPITKAKITLSYVLYFNPLLPLTSHVILVIFFLIPNHNVKKVGQFNNFAEVYINSLKSRGVCVCVGGENPHGNMLP